MAFGNFQDQSGAGQHSQPMAEINTTPLVDVMLVLLVIFIVTAPLLTHGISIDLPKAQSSAAPEEPRTVTLSVDSAGKLFWNDQPIRVADLQARLVAAARSSPQPELHLRADLNTRYQTLAEIMAMARNAGLNSMGFVTDPNVPAPSGAP
ncbi:MAG: biopolymer transporter ExbD [Betaproteobacteria bacterium]|nr:biopolymer transporter ExbD [Betaproteobacteria bacterium]